MRGILILLLGLIMQGAWAQELDIVELGNLVGEMRHFESTVNWTNTRNDTLWVRAWTDRSELQFDDTMTAVAPGQEVTFPYSLNLIEVTGQQSFEARLVTEEEVVIHGWLLKTRVFPAEQDVFEEYMHEFFPFRSKSLVLNMKSGFYGDVLDGTFSLFNFGGQPLDLRGAYSNRDEVSITFSPQEVDHNAFTRININLDSKGQALGFSRDNMSVYAADSSLLFTIPLQLTLENRPVNGFTGTVPHLTVSKLSHDFKVMKGGEKEGIDIRLTNTGHAPLLIEKLESNCDCLEYDFTVKEIEAGQSAVLKVTFNATGRMGYERKTIALFTNDPDQPTRVLTFKAHVK